MPAGWHSPSAHGGKALRDGVSCGTLCVKMSGFKLIRSPMEALKEHFGFSGLREGQDRVVAAIMEGRNVLVVMPTGGGKSLCYQLPALCREGVCLVVSPLIALMKDQVDASCGQRHSRDHDQQLPEFRNRRNACPA